MGIKSQERCNIIPGWVQYMINFIYLYPNGYNYGIRITIRLRKADA